MEPVKRRPYQGAHRARLGKLQSEATRARILDAARRRMDADGYQATTIRAIAEEAGVSEPTVYLHFGSKRAILEALVQLVEKDTLLGSLESRFDKASSAVAAVEAGLAALRRRLETGADVERAMRDARRQGEPLPAWGLAEEARRRHARLLAGRLAGEGRLRAGLSRRRAADVIHLLSSLDVFDVLVGQSGWSPSEYEEWLVDAAKRLLVGRPR